MVLRDGWKCRWNLHSLRHLPDQSLDFIFAACDVEANFLVVKAYQYTNLLSCMLFNSWVLFSPSELPVLSVTRTDGRSHRVYSSHGCSCGPSTPGPSSLYVVELAPVSPSFQLTATILSRHVGDPDLRWRPWDARRIRSAHR